MKVLIIGGGIGGPALATFLARQGKSVTIVERSSEWKNVGYGVTLWGIGRKVLKELGIDASLAQVGYPVPSCHLTSQDDSFSIDVDFRPFAKYGGEMLIVPRADLHKSLVDAIPTNVEILFGTTIKNIAQNESSARVVFDSGIEREFDLVIAADGVHSKIRETISSNDLTYSSWSAIAFWVPDDVVCSKEVVAVSEVGRTACFYPTKDRTFIAIYGHGLKGKPTEDFIKPFIPYFRSHGWRDSDIARILDESPTCFRDDIPYVWMGPWSKGRIVLLGDARHAFAPVIGMGANLALEDAYVLAQELDAVKNGVELTAALEKYAMRRRPRINRIRRLSGFMVPWFNSSSPAFVRVRTTIAPYLPVWILEGLITRVLKERI